MDVLGRESAPINAALWKQIDETVIETARKLLIGRRFLSLAGPLGAGAQSVIVDSAAMEEELEAGIGQIRGRRFQPLIQLFEDFTLLWRDLESVESGMPLDRSRILDAARRLDWSTPKELCICLMATGARVRMRLRILPKA